MAQATAVLAKSSMLPTILIMGGIQLEPFVLSDFGGISIKHRIFSDSVLISSYLFPMSSLHEST